MSKIDYVKLQAWIIRFGKTHFKKHENIYNHTSCLNLAIFHTKPENKTMNVETQDFYLTAYLCLNGIKLVDIKDYGNRKLFVFEDNDEFQELKQKYYWNDANVDPLEYKKEIRRLKGLIFNT